MAEIYLVKNEPDLTIQYLLDLITRYPNHAKVPDALYKLGVAHNQIGQTSKALAYLDQVQREHPSSSAASLAKKFSATL